MTKKTVLLLFAFMLFNSCSRGGGEYGLDANIRTDTLLFLSSKNGEVKPLDYSKAVKEIGTDGLPKICLCRAVGFRMSQIIAALWKDNVLRTHEIESITTGWNSEGPYEFFEETLGMPEKKIIIAPGSASHDELAVKDCWYTFRLTDGRTVTLRGKKEIYGEFLDLRSRMHKGEKGIAQRVKKARTDVEINLAALPCKNKFEISIDKGGKL
ncbi:MAG TPA: hypothetical protein PK926_07145 [Spirochaetota bacterium]|nr:hypothetical protein [Spirochaetota bacterium]HPI90403.1 hypothetical protein [Spirochaetota bacterium]HPR48514.1 hypothetical protein [Spirochaetota bacterium]